MEKLPRVQEKEKKGLGGMKPEKIEKRSGS